MLCPHHDIKIVQRSNRQSAVAAAAYQSGERLFSEYDQKQKYYAEKRGIVHTEIMLPPHAPRSYPVSDKNRLTIDILSEVCPMAEEWELLKELSYLEVREDVLWRPFFTLSNGEQTKVLLAALYNLYRTAIAGLNPAMAVFYFRGLWLKFMLKFLSGDIFNIFLQDCSSSIIAIT